MHKKIMKKCSMKLKKDAEHYEEDEKKSKSVKKKQHDKVEKKEALEASRYLSKKSKKAHEFS